MDISVILPTYKPQKYIDQCLYSLGCQTLSNDLFEILIVLNGCCEPWKSEIETNIAKYLSRHNVKLIQTDQGGVSNARNIALDVAHGKYITFIDDDDYVSPSYLQELYNIVDDDTIALAYPYAFNEGEEGIQIPYPLTQIYDQWANRGKQPHVRIRKYFLGPCMKLIPRHVIDDRRYNVRFSHGEDSIFMFLISDRMKTVSFTPRNAIYYRRIRHNSAMTKHKNLWDVIKNCWQMFLAFSDIYIHNIKNYSLRRYIVAILGLLHAILIKLKQTLYIK